MGWSVDCFFSPTSPWAHLGHARFAGMVKKCTAAEQSEAVSPEYQSYTDEALARNVSGAPSHFIDGEISWGQDRLEFVERARDG